MATEEAITIPIDLPRAEADAFGAMLKRLSYGDTERLSSRNHRYPDGRTEANVMWSALRSVERQFTPATPADNPDADLLALGRNLDAAIAIVRPLLRSDDQGAFDKATDRVRDISEKIAAIPAHTLAGLRIKGRALRWHRDPEGRVGLDEALISSLVDDLVRGAPTA
jgi:hypothetical protein